MQTFTLQVAQRGLVTLPKEVRQAHNIQTRPTGDVARSGQ